VLGLISKQGGPSLEGLLSHGQFLGVVDGRAVIRFGRSQEHSVKMLEKHSKKDLIIEVLSEVLNQKVGVRFEMDVNEEAVSAPAMKPTAGVAGRQAAARPIAVAEAPAAPAIRLTPELRAELELDPLIRSLIDLGGSIVKVE